MWPVTPLGKIEDDGDVVGGETPEYVLLCPDHPQVQPVGVDVMDSPQFAGVQEALQADHGRMIAEEMAHHQDPSSALRPVDQGPALITPKRQGLLDVDILAGFERLHGQRVVRDRRRGDHDSLHLGVLQGLLIRQPGHNPGILLPDAVEPRLVGVADRVERLQGREIPDQVLAPISGADHRHISVSHARASFGHRPCNRGCLCYWSEGRATERQRSESSRQSSEPQSLGGQSQRTAEPQSHRDQSLRAAEGRSARLQNEREEKNYRSAER